MEKPHMGEVWSSRWGLLLAGIGMAVGTGNIWRFPRVAAKNGGGSYILIWLLALFIWSIPLLMMEMVLGRSTRKGPVGAFRDFLGRRFTWMGAWVTWVTIAIMFYYSVVTGWCIRYFGLMLTGQLTAATDTNQVWQNFCHHPYWPVVFHGLAISLAAFIIFFGVVRGIERTNKILLPALFGLLIFIVYKALTLPGAGRGVHFLFSFSVPHLTKAQTWIEAFSQSAWSTGAGWGLLLTYAVYTSRRSEIGQNCFIIGVGNNLASLIAALAVIPTIFALVPAKQVDGVLGAGNQGLTFIHLASLFARMPAGHLVGSLFFLALFFAALSSLISMVEMGARVLMDTGMSRRKAVSIIFGLGFVLGVPSALNMNFFNNQDWVWGVGLLVSGLFVALAGIIKGPELVRREYINASGARWQVGKWWNVCITVLIPLVFVVLLTWWLTQSLAWEKTPWWNPWASYSPGTVFCQWAVILLVVLCCNGKIAALAGPQTPDAGSQEAPASNTQ